MKLVLYLLEDRRMYARIVRARIEREEQRQKENAMRQAHRVCIERYERAIKQIHRCSRCTREQSAVR